MNAKLILVLIACMVAMVVIPTVHADDYTVTINYQDRSQGTVGGTVGVCNVVQNDSGHNIVSVQVVDRPCYTLYAGNGCNGSPYIVCDGATVGLYTEAGGYFTIYTDDNDCGCTS